MNGSVEEFDLLEVPSFFLNQHVKRKVQDIDRNYEVRLHFSIDNQLVHRIQKALQLDTEVKQNDIGELVVQVGLQVMLELHNFTA